MATSPSRPRRAAPFCFLAVWAACCLAALAPTAADGAQGTADPKAAAIAEQAMTALGGEEAWRQTRFIRFSFAGFRTHHWDKGTGRHRLEFTDREGHHQLVLHNVVSREGRAWRDGAELQGEELKAALDGAYGAWINDTYWLVMPYKLRDPGVTLSHDGEETIDGTTYDLLRLRFEQVGLTPGDQYWAYINRETHLMDRWAYHLESYEEGRERTQWLWRGWARYGAIMLAPERLNPDSDRELPLSDISVVDSMADSVFESTDEVAEP